MVVTWWIVAFRPVSTHPAMMCNSWNEQLCPCASSSCLFAYVIVSCILPGEMRSLIWCFPILKKKMVIAPFLIGQPAW